ncbi:hypothetical protein FRC12_006499 [Ceratobasidium sp. 428]|nr:hypothetical protein FRC12_006499 [Ceratobasidium sp. 428]
MTLRRRTFREGTFLLANRAVDLVNLPAARNVAHGLRALAVALKAPGVNDENAREQTNNLELYAEWIETIASRMSQHGVDLDGTVAEFWGLVREFDEYLSNAVQELQELQQLSTTVKLACQNEITRCLDAKKEDTLNRVITFCFKICLLACCIATQTQVDVKQLIELMDVRLRAERLNCDERIKRLEREVSAVLRAQQIDARSYIWLRNSMIAFFLTQLGRVSATKRLQLKFNFLIGSGKKCTVPGLRSVLQ